MHWSVRCMLSTFWSSVEVRYGPYIGLLINEWVFLSWDVRKAILCSVETKADRLWMQALMRWPDDRISGLNWSAKIGSNCKSKTYLKRELKIEIIFFEKNLETLLNSILCLVFGVRDVSYIVWRNSYSIDCNSIVLQFSIEWNTENMKFNNI